LYFLFKYSTLSWDKKENASSRLLDVWSVRNQKCHSWWSSQEIQSINENFLLKIIEIDGKSIHHLKKWFITIRRFIFHFKTMRTNWRIFRNFLKNDIWNTRKQELITGKISFWCWNDEVVNLFELIWLKSFETTEWNQKLILSIWWNRKRRFIKEFVVITKRILNIFSIYKN
jgi:hypothetical protein